jgi:hypothetical protein
VSFHSDPARVLVFSDLLLYVSILRMCGSIWSFKTTVAMLKYLTKVVRYYSRVFNVWDPNPVPELLKVAGSGFLACLDLENRSDPELDMDGYGPVFGSGTGT